MCDIVRTMNKSAVRLVTLIAMTGCSPANAPGSGAEGPKDMGSPKDAAADANPPGDGGPLDAGGPGRLCALWDPGLLTRRARNFFPGMPNFTSFCDGPCDDAALGFYTLTNGEGEMTQSCAATATTGAPYSPTANSTIPCPYHFSWATDETGANVAAWSTDTLGLSPLDINRSPNFGMALQENISLGGGGTGGLDWNNHDQTPPVVDVDTIAFDYRAKLCAGANAADPLRIAHLTTYLSFWNPTLPTGNTGPNGPEMGIGGDLVVDLDDVVVGTTDPPVAWGTMKRQWDLYHPNTADAWKLKNTIQMNGRREGLSTGGGFAIDQTPDCSLQLGTVPFSHVELRVDTLRARALANFTFVDANDQPVAMFADDSARVVSVLLVGSEHWGRIRTKVQLKNYRVRMKPGAGHGIPCDPGAGP